MPFVQCNPALTSEGIGTAAASIAIATFTVAYLSFSAGRRETNRMNAKEKYNATAAKNGAPIKQAQQQRERKICVYVYMCIYIYRIATFTVAYFSFSAGLGLTPLFFSLFNRRIILDS